MSITKKLSIYFNEDVDDSKNRKNLPLVLYGFLFAIFYFATWYDPLYTIRDPRTAQEMGQLVEKGDLGRRIALFSLGGWGLFNIIFHVRKKDMRIDLGASLIIFYIIWVALSISWSDDMILTLRKVVAMSMLWLGATWIAIRYSIRDVTYFAFFSGVTTIIFGIITEAYLGTFHPLDIYYRFAGTFHPNTQGMNCAILAIASYSLSKTENKWKSVFYIFTLIAFMFLILTKSRASFLGALIAISIIWTIASSKNRKIACFTIAIIFGCILILFFGDQIFDSIYRATYIGREVFDLDSFSLRLPLWQECMRYISHRPVQGFGYDSFWTARRVSEISMHQGWPVPHSHSGYIELALGLGIIGLFTYIFMLFIGAKRAFSAYKITRDNKYLFCISLIILLIINMFFEIVNMHPFISNFLCIIVIIKMSLLNIKHLKQYDKTI